jgi:hypothetical protein
MLNIIKGFIRHVAIMATPVMSVLGFIRKDKMTTREEVYRAIDGERDYQEFRWNEKTTSSGGQHTVAEFVLYMEHYLDEARRQLSTQKSPRAEADGLEFVRKVTALGVVCMEQNGAPQREGFEVF